MAESLTRQEKFQQAVDTLRTLGAGKIAVAGTVPGAEGTSSLNMAYFVTDTEPPVIGQFQTFSSGLVDSSRIMADDEHIFVNRTTGHPPAFIAPEAHFVRILQSAPPLGQGDVVRSSFRKRFFDKVCENITAFTPTQSPATTQE